MKYSRFEELTRMERCDRVGRSSFCIDSHLPSFQALSQRSGSDGASVDVRSQTTLPRAFERGDTDPGNAYR